MTMTDILAASGRPARLRTAASRPLDSPGERGADAVDNLYGGCSMQVFDPATGAANLSNTHADANGFLNYVNQFDLINFHFEDSAVEQWEYSPTYDDWQRRYGMDAVRAFYHSGHGGMDATNGVFYAPLGARWNNQDWAVSSAMSLGDRFLRYVFWSTCESLGVLNGHSPIRTWNAVNKGLRMIFGFQSTSLDSPDYGANFFSKWNAGESFSQAWQDASMAISSNMQVSSSACGASAADAQNRLWNERLFYGDAVSAAWYWWRWAGNAPDAPIRAAHRQMPAVVRRAALGRRTPDEALNRVLLARYGLAAQAARDGAMVAESGATRLAVFADGSHAIRWAEPDRAAPLAPHAVLREAADAVLRDYGVSQRTELVFDRATATFHAGSAVDAQPGAAAVADVTLHYRQMIDGIPVVMGEAGHVRVTLDPGGQPIRLADHTSPVTRLAEARPGPGPRDPAAMVADGVQMLLRQVSAGGVTDARAVAVPGTAEIGYRLTGAGGALVARCEVEITAGRFRKLHAVERPL